MKIRLTGRPADIESGVATISALPGFDLTGISGPHPNRGPSRLVRVYLDIRLTSPPASGQPQPGKEMPA